MAKVLTQGVCQLCKGVFSKGAMTRHLTKCLAAPAEAVAKDPPVAKLHITVEGKYRPEYWLHVEMDAASPLYELDGFLRDIWLECCGHLSSFTIGGVMYSDQPGGGFVEEEDMSAPVGTVLKKGLRFAYEYDFGSTTDLILKVVAERTGPARPNEVRLLARNEAPALLCDRCGKPAKWVEAEGWGSGELLCGKCGGRKEGFLPVVNSPRMGVCGYGG
jgi:hypothetical protein